MTTFHKQAGQLVSTWRDKIKSGRKRSKLHKQMKDIDPIDLSNIERVMPFTMLSPDRLYAFMQATRHICHANIPGAVVECGVWKGGAVMSSLLTMRDMNRTDREYFLYDTFEGMPMPSESDKKYDGDKLLTDFQERQIGEDGSSWCRGEFNEVQENVYGTGYDPARIHFIKGKVEETIPHTLPDQIAILRLDTDWYESTRHELEYLYPRLSPGGVLIIDDYGHWEGARQAVDEYFAEHHIPMLLHRTDYTGRIGVKAA
ncbi:MAG TPA: macrocin O-methyltransferase [Planctomycetaceae bacterium]|nr:macrocin O-methyltransferase [Planctomycetaceae bacterium]